MSNRLDNPKSVEHYENLAQCLRAQRRPLMIAGTFVYLPVLLLLLGTGLYTLVTPATLPFFLNEAKAIYSIPFHAGALSSVGVLLWGATASVCLFTSLVLHGSSLESDRTHFLLSAGLLTAVLTIDDLFLIHDDFAPNYLNISEKFVLSLLLISILYFLTYYLYTILKTDFFILLISLSLLAISFLSDLIFEYKLLFVGAELRGLRYLLEEGSKLLGIAGWLGYFGRVCYTSLVRSLSSVKTSPRA